MNVDIGKSGNPLNLWGMELGWTVIELQAAQQVGRPIDTQKYDGMQLKWQMDNDEQVYVGDSALNLKGLVTLDGVPVNNAAKTWATSTPDEIRASINQVLSDAWAASGYSVVPRDLLIPPEQFALLSSIIVSSAGNQSLFPTVLGASLLKAVMLWRKTLPRTGSLVRTRKYPLAKPQTRVTR